MVHDAVERYFPGLVGFDHSDEDVLVVGGEAGVLQLQLHWEHVACAVFAEQQSLVGVEFTSFCFEEVGQDFVV